LPFRFRFKARRAEGGFEPPLPGRVKRFSRPSPENSNSDNNKDLQSQASGAYKPAYKENPKTAKNLAENLPNDLAEIVAAWPELPEHIKAAIKALVHSHI